MHELYHYRARVTDLYDGDSIYVMVDLGLGITRGESFAEATGSGMLVRLAGIDAPEISGEERPEGLKSKAFLRELVVGEMVVMETAKDATGKYGRYIATVYLPEEGKTVEDYDRVAQMRNVNDLMLEEGMAEPYTE